MIIDGWGSSGLILDYALVLFFTGGALLLFIYLWSKKRLNLEEDPKFTMLEDDHGGK